MARVRIGARTSMESRARVPRAMGRPMGPRERRNVSHRENPSHPPQRQGLAGSPFTAGKVRFPKAPKAVQMHRARGIHASRWYHLGLEVGKHSQRT